MSVAQSLEESLTLIEHEFRALSQALLDGSPDSLIEASNGLHRQLLEFLAGLQGVRGLHSGRRKALVLRVKTMAQTLPVLRETMQRKAALVDRGLEILVPATRTSTYGQANGKYGSGGPRSSGEFRAFSA